MEAGISGIDFAVSWRLQRYAKRLVFTLSALVAARYSATGFLSMKNSGLMVRLV
jgi:hypothetical protein